MALGGDGDEVVAMDSRLWSALQDHIDLKQIYTRLPLEDFCRLRVVCKDWHRATLTSPLRKPYFLISAQHITTTLTCLLTFTGSQWLASRAPEHKLNVDGFLYWHEHDIDGYAVNPQVLNLHSRVLHKLPRVPEPDGEPFVALRANSSASFLVVYAGGHSCTQVYDSTKENSWTIDYDHVPEMAPGSQYSCAEANGFLYLRTELDGIMSFDLASGAWNMYMEPPPGDCDDYLRTIGAWDGRLIVITVALQERKITAWALEQAKWESVMQMPDEFYTWIAYEDDPSVDVDTDGEIRTSFCGEFVLVYTWLLEVGIAERFLMANLERKTWEKVEVPFGSCCVEHECEL